MQQQQNPSEVDRARPRAGMGHYLRDIVYGASDGVITTSAVIAGAVGASFEARVGIVLGLANLAADGISMGASNYLGLKSELEQTGASVGLEQPWRHGAATALAFMLAGGVPLLSYFASSWSPQAKLMLALLLAAAVLAFVGGARARFVGRSALSCALEMLAVAGGASGVAYLLGVLIEPLTR
jgi:VIT1/CCC1 family predicted Fe2+/Mn2+ transporter